MGIQGLIPFLKPIHEDIHLRDLSGLTVGVDAYVWLHRGAFSCATELILGMHTRKYISYCMKKIKLLRDHNVTPVIVFDGGYLPMKAATEHERRDRREERRAKGMAYWKSGDKTKAGECFQTCVDITPEMAYEFIKTLRLARIQYIVAPYEADAQLAYLARTNRIDAVLTEDSDLLVFGCPRVIFKLDPLGNALQIQSSNFGNIPGMRFWTLEQFRHMCILSGCDYLASPQGIGLKKAQGLIQKSTNVFTLIKSWNIWGSTVKAPKLPENYLERFIEADQTFLYQRVYDPDLKRLVTLNPLPEDLIHIELCDFIGADLEPELAQKIAEGDVDPISKLPFDQLASQKHTVIGANENAMIPLKRTYSTSDLPTNSLDEKIGTLKRPILHPLVHGNQNGLSSPSTDGACISSQPIKASEKFIKTAIIRVEPKKPIVASLGENPLLKPSGRLSLPPQTDFIKPVFSITNKHSSFFSAFRSQSSSTAASKTDEQTDLGKSSMVQKSTAPEDCENPMPNDANIDDSDRRDSLLHETDADGKENAATEYEHHYHVDIVSQKSKSAPSSRIITSKSTMQQSAPQKSLSGQISLEKFMFKGIRLSNSLQMSALEPSSSASSSSSSSLWKPSRPSGLKPAKLSPQNGPSTSSSNNKSWFSKKSSELDKDAHKATKSEIEGAKPKKKSKGKTLGLRATSTITQHFKSLVGSFEYKSKDQGDLKPENDGIEVTT